MTATASPQLFIGGEFRAAAMSLPVLEAATGESLGDGASATESPNRSSAPRSRSTASASHSLTRYMTSNCGVPISVTP